MLVAKTVVAPLLVVFTSAYCRTVVTNLPFEPSLSEGTRSSVSAVLETVFVTTPLSGAVTVMVKLVNAPASSVGRVGQTTVPKSKSLVPSLEALTNVTFVGNRSVTMRLVAVLGPKLVTEIV